VPRTFISRSAADVADPAEVLDRIAAEALLMIEGADGASIEVRDGEMLEYVSGARTLARFVGLQLRVDGSLSGRCVTSAQVVRCDDALHDDRVDREAVRLTGVRSMLCVPLRVSSRTDAVLKVSSETPNAFTDADAAGLQRLAEVLSIAVTAAADLAAMSEERLVLAERLVRLAEAEQRRLALALHDDPVQRLSAAMYQLAMLRHDVADDGLPALERIETLMRGALVSLRRLMFEIAPPDLDPATLAETLVMAAEELFADAEVEVDVDVQCDRLLGLSESQLVYRIAVEALGNARRHASADRVHLRVRITDAGIAVDVVDDGSGFDPDAATPGHLGLQSLKERARLLGGAVTIDSAPGAGARLTVRVPPGIDL
jgi:signal transduction histidine kinase